MLGVVVLCTASASAQPAPSSALPHPNGGWGAVWSPQGDRLAFLSSDDGLPAEIWVCDPQGLGFRCVTHGGAADPGWAPDGRSLSYTTSRRGHPERWHVNLDSGRESPGAPRPGLPAETAQTPSPDGDSVAYTLADLKSRDLYLVTGAAEAKRLTAGFTVRNVAWSPRGDRVAFDGLNPLSKGLPQVWLYDLATSELAHVGSSGSFGPVWSPKGNLLAYTMLAPGKSNRIAIASVDTVLKLTPRKPKGGAAPPELDITRGGLVPDLPYLGDGMAWSPHGDLLAVVVRAEDGQQLWLVKTDGTIAAKLSQPGLQFRFPAWSPDGGAIALEAVRTGVSPFAEVWLADAAGKEWRCLAPSRPSYWALSPAADGRLAFLGNTNGTVAAWTLRARSSGAETSATSLAGTEGATAVAASPAGDRALVLKPQEVALLSYDGKPLGTLPLSDAVQANWSPRGDRVALVLMGASGDETIKLLSVSPDGVLAEMATVAGGDPAWRPDGGAVAFARGDAVWRMDADGGAPAALATVAAAAGEETAVLSPAWDPTGARLAFAVARADPAGWQQELWLLSVGGAGTPAPQPAKLYSEPVSTEYAFSPARWDALPAWSREGRLLFASDRDGSPRVWSIRADGSDLRAVTPPRAAWPALGPDGLYFVRLDSDTPIWKAAVDGSDVVPLAWRH